MLLDDIVDYARIESGEMALETAEFPLAPAVQEVVGAVRPLMESNGNRLEIHAPFDLGAMHADRRRVYQCLYNLLSNAAKFTRDGTVALRVGEGGDGRLRFSVSSFCSPVLWASPPDRCLVTTWPQRPALRWWPPR